MKGELLLRFVIGFTLGFTAGMITHALISNAKSKFGVLKIDKSNEENDMYSLELGNLDDLEGKKRVVLKIQEVNSARD